MRAKAFSNPRINQPAKLLLILFAVLLGSASAVRGAVRTWTGGYWSGYWSASSNWDTGVPQMGDDLVFPDGISGADLISTNNLGNRTFGSITIQGNGYMLRGSTGSPTITVTDGISSTKIGSLNTIDLNIDLAASQSVNCSWSNAELYLNGNVDLGSYTLSTLGAGEVQLNGLVSGTGGITKKGSGTHWLGGSANNTYTGDTRVNSGTLMLAKAVRDAIPAGHLYVGDGSGDPDTAVVKEVGNFQIETIPVTVYKDGHLDMGNYSDTIDELILYGGHAGSSGTGILRLFSGDVTVNVSDQNAEIDGRFDCPYGLVTFDVADGSPGYDLRVTAVIGGSDILKTGGGSLALYGANIHTGETTVNQGGVYVRNSSALGTTAGGTTVDGTGFVYLVGVSVAGEALALDKPASSGTVLYASSTSIWSGDVALTDDARISSSGSLELSGVISGTGGISMSGSGTYIFSGSTANSYNGDTIVNAGTLLLDKSVPIAIRYGSLTIGNGSGSADEVVVRAQSDHQINSTVPITINVDGWLDMDAYTDTVGAIIFNGGHAGSSTGSLNLGGAVTVNASSSEAELDGNVYMGSGTRTFNVANGSAGFDLIVNAVLSGNGLTKTGEGTMSLLGANTFTGETTINQGRVYAWDNDAFGTTANGTTVGASGFIQLVSVNIGVEPLILGRTDSGSVLYASGSCSWAGDVLLAEDASMGTSGSMAFSGGISGAGGIIITSGGTFTLSGGNSYAGDTTVNAGALELQGSNRIRYGTLTIGDNGGAKESVVVRFLSAGPIHSDADIVINSDGLLDFNNYSDYIGAVMFDRGKLSTGTGTYRMGGDVEVIESFETNWTAMISGNVDLSNQQRTFDVDTAAFLDLAAPTEGSAGLTKAGGGQLRLGWPNTYEGTTIAQEGYLQLWHAGSLGATNSGTVVESGATLHFGKSLTISNEVLELNGFGAPSYGALDCTFNASWIGPVVLGTDSEIYVANNRLEINGSVSGSGSLTKIASGTLAFMGSDANTYTGATYVNDGMLALEKTIFNSSLVGDLYVGDGFGGADVDVVRLENTSQIPNTTRITIASSGLFDLNNLTEAFGSLVGSGHVTTGIGELAPGYDNTSTEFSGLIEGSGSFRKHGSGSFELTGNNTYSGDTYIYAGTLMVNGSQPGSDVIVYSSGTLGGIGTVGAITSSGSVAPGKNAGELSAANTALSSGSTFDLELDGYTSVDYDQLDVNGTVSLGNSDLNITWGFVPALGDSFIILDNDGADGVVGTFNGLAEGASVVAGNVTLQISYAGGTGNDVILAATDVQPLEDLMITSIGASGGNVNMDWVGGVPPFVVEKKTSLTNESWIAVTFPTRDFTGSVPSDTTNGFYRVTGGN